MSERHFSIGNIVNTQGIKGDVRVVPQTFDPSRFELLDEVEGFLPGKHPVSLAIEKVWYHKGFVVLKFKGIDDMTSAERLKGMELKIPPEKALPLEEGEYYIRDIYGLKVLTDEGEDLGEIDDIIQTGANDVYVAKNSKGKTLMIPAIKQCVLGVDLERRVMTVKLIDGLRDL
ncbi:MAG: ribosome maturation factor RimM [Clostridiales bacterium]|jgi:16S rRNA processing protein RimM|nr:ribosome maturation factor RimM [Clostridiales bacterium]